MLDYNHPDVPGYTRKGVKQMDNTTPMRAKEYDAKIENTIPFYSEFYRQTIDLVKALRLEQGKCLV